MRTRCAVAVLCGVLVASTGGCGGDNGGDGESSAGTTTPESTETAEPFDLATCFENAGAKIATSPSDLSFAKGKSVLSGAENAASGELPDGTATYSTKSTDTSDAGWHIYTGQEGPDPGFSEVVEDPASAQVVAYVHPDDPAVVAKADDCMDGVVGNEG